MELPVIEIVVERAALREVSRPPRWTYRRPGVLDVSSAARAGINGTFARQSRPREFSRTSPNVSQARVTNSYPIAQLHPRILLAVLATLPSSVPLNFAG